MNSVLKPLFDELTDLYARGQGVLGCYVSGNVTDGVFSSGDGIEFYVITDGYQGFLERIHGARRVEIHWRPEQELRSEVRAGGTAIYALMEAVVVIDPHGQIQDLMEMAKQTYASFRPSISVLRDIHYRVGDARLKLLSARKSGDVPLQAYLSATCTGLLFEAMFLVAGKPPVHGLLAWRWIRKTEGIAAEGVAQIENVLQMEVLARAQAFDALLYHLHGVLTSKMKGDK
jgi:hypothetical protein